MSDIKEKFGTSNQTVTCTVTSLANNAQRASVAIDNSANLYEDILIHVKVKTAGSGTSATGTVNVYACGTADGGTTYTDGVASGDATCTLTAPPNAQLIGVINCVANSVTYNGGPFSVAKAPAWFGVCPEKVVVVVENKTGATLDASVGAVWYQGKLSQVG